MNSSSVFAKLRETVFKPQHPYRTSLQVFPDIDIDRLSMELDVSMCGQDRGRQNLPKSTSGGFDEVEHRLIERISAEHKSAHGKLLDELAIYEERLGSIDVDARISEIRNAISSVQTEFRAEASQGRDDLNALRRRLKDAEREKTEFQTRYGLTRAARTKSAAGRMLSVALIAFLLLIETWVNGTFLAVGNEAGLVGGFTQAFSFAALNVLVSFGVGLLWLRYLNRPGFWAICFGALGLIAYLAFAIGLNLGLAHFRDIAAYGAGGGSEALNQMLRSPFSLRDINSWIFFGVGMAFSAASCLDGLFFDDPFPGYGAIEKRRLAAHDAYLAATEALRSRLKDVRDDANEQLKELQRDLNIRRSYHDATLAARSQIIDLFRAHERQLQGAGNLLLSRYREANQTARTTKPPRHFDKPWLITPMPIDVASNDAALREALKARIEDNQKVVDSHFLAMYAEFDKAMEAYRNIDELVDDEGVVTPSKAPAAKVEAG